MASVPLREIIGREVVRILRERRLQRRISMKVLAARAGLSQSMISLMERDLRNPTLDTLLRVAEVLELELDEVLLCAKKAAARKHR